MELLAASTSTELTGSPVTVSLPIEHAESRSLAAAIDDAAPDRISLDVEGIETERNPGIVYQLFLNAPESTAAADSTQQTENFVGHVSFFGANHTMEDDAGHQGPPGPRHTYDVTGLVHQLQAQGRWDPNHVTVTFVPLGLLPPVSEAATRGVAEPAPPVSQSPVRIARVGLYRH